MSSIGGEELDRAVDEDGANQGHVEDVIAAAKRVVGNDDVSRLQVVGAVFLQQLADVVRSCSDVEHATLGESHDVVVLGRSGEDATGHIALITNDR